MRQWTVFVNHDGHFKLVQLRPGDRKRDDVAGFEFTHQTQRREKSNAFSPP